MRRTGLLALVGAALIVLPPAVALAADMPEIPPPPQFGGGWYLRGDIGFTNQRVGSLYNILYEDVDSVNTIQKDFSAAPFIGVGFGYQYSDHFRVDFTGEYRGGADFHGLDIVNGSADPNDIFDDQYTAIKKEWTFLANAYWDFGEWHGFKPFVGAGIGTSINTISNFMDVSLERGSVATGASKSKWNLAWALYAGVGYQVTPNLTLEAGYRYIDLGNAASGDLVAFDGTNDVYNPMEFRHLTSHDFKVGFRYAFDKPAYYPSIVKY